MDTTTHLNPNVAARLSEIGGRHPDRSAIVACRGGRSRRVTFGELAERVHSLAADLRAEGLTAGDRVLLFVPMSIDLYVAVIACLHLGGTVVFVDAWANRERLDAAIDAARPRAFIGSPRAHMLRLLSGAARRIPIRRVVGRGWLDRARGARGAEVAAVVAPDHPALVTFTTGSTGKPKAAARSHAFLWAQHQALVAYLRPLEADIDMPTLPIFVLNNLALGVTSVLPDFDPRRPAEIDPASIYRQMVTEQVTTSSGSPAFYEKLAGWCARNRRGLPLRALFTGGAPVLPPLARLLQETVAGTAHVVYGSTEAEPIAGITVPEMLQAMEAGAAEDRSEGLCVGRPVPEIAARVVRACDGPIRLGPDGWRAWEVPPGRDIGELVVTGRHVLGGYLADPASDRENKILEGDRVWHRTGDAVRLDGEGRLWLMGRVSERVQRGSQVWWSIPAEVRALEKAVATRAAYLGLPDPGLGQRAVLCVETRTGRLSHEERHRLTTGLAPIPVDDLHAVRRLPRDPRHASKTNTEALRRLLARR